MSIEKMSIPESKNKADKKIEGGMQEYKENQTEKELRTGAANTKENLIDETMHIAPILTHENKKEISKEEWDSEVSKIVNEAMAMATGAREYSAQGFGGDVREVGGDFWSAAVRMVDGKPKKVEAIWIPESEGDDEKFWQGIDIPE